MDDKFKLHLFNRLNYKYNSGIPLLDPICNAPFTNMLFVPSGKVMACHYNRGKVMGDICETTLEEIWNSNNYNELRHKISHNNFSFGCQNCFYELKNKNYFLSGTYKYNHVKRRADHMPVLFDFQLENTCNLECIMCSSEYSSTIQTHRENQLKSDSPYNENFLQQITQFIPHLKAASFTGGEPFIIKIYRELWKLFISTNPTIPLYVSTNASYIPDSVKPILEEGNFNFTVSIDSLKQEIYENIRKNASFNNTIQNIDYLTSVAIKKNNTLSIKIVVMTLNAKELPEMIQYWSAKDIQVYPKLLWVPVFLSLKQLPEKETDELINFYKSFSFPLKTDIQRNNNNRFQEIIHQLIIWKTDKIKTSEGELVKKNLDELKFIFSKNLSDAVINDFNLNMLKRESLLITIENTLLELYSKEHNTTSLKTSLIHFISLAPETLVAEIERSQEKFIERFRYESNNNKSLNNSEP